MKTKNEGLQKLTDENINRVLELKKITYDDLDTLSDSERAKVLSILSKKLNESTNIERDKYWEKILPVAGEETRNNYWECNHNKMVQEISKFIQTYGRMPTKTEIADATGLSRTRLLWKQI